VVVGFLSFYGRTSWHLNLEWKYSITGLCPELLTVALEIYIAHELWWIACVAFFASLESFVEITVLSAQVSQRHDINGKIIPVSAQNHAMLSRWAIGGWLAWPLLLSLQVLDRLSRLPFYRHRVHGSMILKAGLYCALCGHAVLWTEIGRRLASMLVQSLVDCSLQLVSSTCTHTPSVFSFLTSGVTGGFVK